MYSKPTVVHGYRRFSEVCEQEVGLQAVDMEEGEAEGFLRIIPQKRTLQ